MKLALARPAQLPLLSVSNCSVPTSLRLCFSVFDRTNMKVSWTMCEDAAAAAQEKYRIKPDQQIPADAFTFTCDSECSALVFATDGLSGSAISARQFPTGSPASPSEASEYGSRPAGRGEVRPTPSARDVAGERK